MKRRGNELQSAVARRLSSLRQARGLTQEGVANRLGIASQNIQRIESGRQNLTLQTIERVAGAIGIDVDEVLRVTASTTARPRFLEVERAGVLRASVDPPVPVPVYRSADGARYVRGTKPTPIGWVMLADDVDDGSFIVRLEDSALEPRVPLGSWSLFRPLRKAPASRAIVLAELSTGSDIDVVVRLVEAGPDEAGRWTLCTLQPQDTPVVFVEGLSGRLLAEYVRTVALDG